MNSKTFEIHNEGYTTKLDLSELNLEERPRCHYCGILSDMELDNAIAVCWGCCKKNHYATYRMLTTKEAKYLVSSVDRKRKN